jgi:serine/threonine protein kinase
MAMKPPSVDRETFLASLRRSGLLSERELESVLRRLPETDRGRLVAKALVEAGLLTRFQAGQLLAGRSGGFHLGQYRIMDYIGQGGMGRVYKAMHRTMKRVVALKVLAPDLVKTEKARRLFKHEVRAAARLLHPNIVTAYDANKVAGRYFLVMEYVDGPNLDQLVRRRGPLPISLACEVVRQTALGLQYAYEMGMVHRDIKPANLLVQKAGPGSSSASVQVKILDFGLARLHETEDGALAGSGTIQTAPNTVLGTPDYLSPEQSRSLHGVDIRSDLYSLGCTFYFMLTAKVPFPGGSSVAKLLRHTSEEAVPVEQLRPEVPATVAYIIRRLMAKDPNARFQTPAELAEALVPFSKVGPASGLALHRPARSERLTPAEPGPESSAIELGEEPPPPPAVAESTWPPDFAPTPLSAVPLGADEDNARRRARQLLLISGAVATLIGALGLFLALQ